MNLLKILFSSLSLLISSYALRVSPTIQKTAKYSSQSYDDINKSKSKSKLITRFDDNIGLRAYEDKRDLVLTIRGSCNLEDWKVNLNCLLVEHPHIPCGNVHRGYLTNLLNIIDLPEFEYIKTSINKQNINNVLITGHSSGAAKGILIGHYLAKMFPNVKFTVVTFGCPKLGDSDFYNDIDKLRNINIISINFNDDFVPHLGFGTKNSDIQLDIYSEKLCFNLIKSHLMSRYEDALIKNKHKYHFLETGGVTSLHEQMNIFNNIITEMLL